MKKVLITGFEPFGGEVINPSYEAIKNINRGNLDCELFILEVPTEFYVCSRIVIESIKKINPDIVILVGQAGGRKEISVERVAINLDDTNIPDNRGIKPIDNPISLFGESAYFSTLPIKRIVDELKKNYIPAGISNSAGTYVCNHLMYCVLHELKDKEFDHIQAGFIHVPYVLEQTKNKQNIFSLDLNVISNALEIIIQTTLL
ncbi:MAG: pyroglutamyl-peptidase I [Acholeplasmataceae bacterium]|nr:pyroglutamyl-peptidase I [Acholeplasmataceae bacterium]